MELFLRSRLTDRTLTMFNEFAVSELVDDLTADGFDNTLSRSGGWLTVDPMTFDRGERRPFGKSSEFDQ